MAVISWDPPPFEHQNGIITYYLLLITQSQFNISERVINTTSDVTTYTVTDLEEYNNYHTLPLFGKWMLGIILIPLVNEPLP